MNLKGGIPLYRAEAVETDVWVDRATQATRANEADGAARLPAQAASAAGAT